MEKDPSIQARYQGVEPPPLKKFEQAAVNRKGSHPLIISPLTLIILSGEHVRGQTQPGEFSAVSRCSQEDVLLPVTMYRSVSFFEDSQLNNNILVISKQHQFCSIISFKMYIYGILPDEGLKSNRNIATSTNLERKKT